MKKMACSSPSPEVCSAVTSASLIAYMQHTLEQ